VNVLEAGREGDQGSVERCNWVEIIQYHKIAVKMSWLFFANNLESLCDTENFEVYIDVYTH
jgi:hypothetical protein